MGEAKVYAGTTIGRNTVLHMLARHNIFEKSTQATPSVIETPVQHQNNANKFNRVLVLDSFNNCVPPVQTMHATVAAIPNSFASLNQHREQLNGAGQAITVLNKEGAVVHESIHVGTILCGKNLHTVGQRNLLQSWKNSRQSNLETMTQLEQMKLKLDVQKWDKFDNYSLVLCSIVEGEYLRLKGLTKTNKTFTIVGCTPAELKIHLEKQFKPGMTWWNHTPKGWHIDHIIPLASAETIEETEKLSHYTNLQPMWAKENMKKGNKIL